MLEKTASKTPNQENFPVGSFLLQRQLRPVIAAYYAFARAADDIADCPQRAALEKVAELKDFRAILHGRKKATADHPALRLRPLLLKWDIPFDRASDLLIAFERDATQARYRNWQELMDYCRYSAAPVGRFLLDLHGQTAQAYPASDALCSALQIINHLQDCRLDYQRLDRIYLPQDWMGEAAVQETDLAKDHADKNMRHLLHRVLDGTVRLMEHGNALPGLLASRRIAMESATIGHIAWGLIDRLRRQDPLAQRVVLGRFDILRCFALGIRDGWQRRSLTVKESS